MRIPSRYADEIETVRDAVSDASEWARAAARAAAAGAVLMAVAGVLAYWAFARSELLSLFAWPAAGVALGVVGVSWWHAASMRIERCWHVLLVAAAPRACAALDRYGVTPEIAWEAMAEAYWVRRRDEAARDGGRRLPRSWTPPARERAAAAALAAALVEGLDDAGLWRPVEEQPWTRVHVRRLFETSARIAAAGGCSEEFVLAWAREGGAARAGWPDAPAGEIASSAREWETASRGDALVADAWAAAGYRPREAGPLIRLPDGDPRKPTPDDLAVMAGLRE